MGYIRHNAIVVTSFKSSHVEAARVIARNLGMLASEIIHSQINGYSSFFIAPDGSKEGWDGSNEGDERRNEFFKAIERLSVDAVDISYGGDGDDAFIEQDTERPEVGASS